MRKMLLIALMLTAMPAMAADFPKVGQPAPSFRLKSQAAKEVQLSDFRGRWVVLYFYPKDFTGGCTLEAKNFQRDLAQYAKRNATIVGVSVDTAKSHKEFCTKEGLNFTLLSDPKGKASKAYNSTVNFAGKTLSARNTFLIDPQGKIARVFTGVKPAGHSAEVLAALDAAKR